MISKFPNMPSLLSTHATRFLSVCMALLLVACASVLFAEDAVEDIDGRYSFLRVLDGSVSLLNAGGDEETDAVANYPVLTGDRLMVARLSRVDIVLSDGSQLALDENTEVLFENLSGSPDGRSDEEGTLLQIAEGDAYLAIGLDRSSEFYPVVDTVNSRVYVQEDGVYLIQANSKNFSRISVYSGSLEVLTEGDSILLEPGDALAVNGIREARTTRLDADYSSALAGWAEAQEQRFTRTTSDRLDAPLAGSGNLDNTGDWVTIDTTVAWKPRVDKTWRPYHRGRWAHTPSGLYWVSNDPWLPVTYRYGNWDLHSQYGWLWYPGYRYRPAHVYWYWGDSYAGWVPSGYYNRHYGSRYAGYGFRSGVLGYAGFRWDPFYDWTFCPIGRIGYYDSHRYYEGGRSLGSRGVRLNRGIIATSTYGVTRDHFRRPALIGAALERGWRAEGRGANLPDVTSLVAKRELSPATRSAFLTRKAEPTDPQRRTAVTQNGSGRDLAVGRTARRSDRSATPATRRSTRDTSARSPGGDLRSARTERRSATPTTGSTRGAVRRSSQPGSSETGTSSRGAVRRTGEAKPLSRTSSPDPGARTSRRSQSPARRVIDGAGSRAPRGSSRPSVPSTRSSGTRRAPTATTRAPSKPQRSASPPRSSKSSTSRPPRSSSSVKKTPPSTTRRSSTTVQRPSVQRSPKPATRSSSTVRRTSSSRTKSSSVRRSSSSRSSSSRPSTRSSSSSSRSKASSGRSSSTTRRSTQPSRRPSSSSNRSRSTSRAKKPPSLG